ncbi:MAG TPA: orotate phosphoribosyltransferase [bacterium]|nr:orotate phosphoribosyltransferase [bacterium]
MRADEPDARARTWTRLARAAFLHGEFVLSSGRRSSYYIDKYLFETDPELLREISRLLAGMLPAGTTRLIGPALGGVPLATAVALETGLPFAIVRPGAKEYGTAKTIEGRVEAGDRAVVLEDVVTTGAQSVRAARTVEEAGAKVLAILAVIDRHEGGREGVEGAGFRFDALYDLAEWKP